MKKIIEKTKEHPLILTSFILASIYDAITTSLIYYNNQGVAVEELSPLISPILPQVSPLTATALMITVMLPVYLLISSIWVHPAQKFMGYYSLIAIITSKTLAGTNNLLLYLSLQKQTPLITPNQHLALIILTYGTLVTLILYGFKKDWTTKKQKKELEKLPQQDFS